MWLDVRPRTKSLTPRMSTLPSFGDEELGNARCRSRQAVVRVNIPLRAYRPLSEQCLGGVHLGSFGFALFSPTTSHVAPPGTPGPVSVLRSFLDTLFPWIAMPRREHQGRIAAISDILRILGAPSFDAISTGQVYVVPTHCPMSTLPLPHRHDGRSVILTWIG